MADQYLQQLTEDTAPVASNFIPSSDSGTGRLKKLKNSRFIYEHQTSTPDANITGEVGVLDIVTMSSMTANRDYVLPTTAAVGERCGISIVDGDDTYGVLIKSGAAGDKINNVDHSSTEWSRLFIAGESVTFVCIDAAGPHWQVENDRRIPCKCRLTRDAVLLLNNNTSTPVLFDNEDYDVGDIGDPTTLNKIVVRRAGYYKINACAALPSVLDLAEILLMYIITGGVTQVSTRRVAAATDQTVEMSETYFGKLAVDDDIRFSLLQNSGGNYNTPTGLSTKPKLMVYEQL